MTTTEIIPYIFYRNVPDALEWLARAFGFKEDMRTGTPSGGMHGEMSFQGQRIMMGQGAKDWGMISPREAQIATMGVFIYLDVSMRIMLAPAMPVPRSSIRRATSPMGAPTARATWTAIPGSSPRRRNDLRHRPSAIVFRPASVARMRKANSGAEYFACFTSPEPA